MAFSAPLRAQTRPLLPEPPLGTGQAAFAGGGTAHISGLDAVFSNPAALSSDDSWQAETGLMGFAGGVSPYALFGSRGAEKSAYAFGYFYDARPGDPDKPAPPRQGLIAGASWAAFSMASLGASVHSAGTGAGVGLNGFGIDEDLGAVVKPWRALRLGLAAHNLQESGVGQEPDGFRTRRSYAASLGAAGTSADLLGLTFHDPDLYYEFRSVGPFDGRMLHIFSAYSGITPEGKLGFRGTLLLPQAGTLGVAFGASLNLPLGRGALLFAYTFQTGGWEATGERDASHSISINIRMGVKPVPLPLTVEVTADKEDAPSFGSAPAPVDFHLSVIDKSHSHGPAGDMNAVSKSGGDSARKAAAPETRALSEGRIREWILTIRAVGAGGLAGATVKTYQGRDLPPKVIRWDVADENGKRLPAGFYSFRLQASDAQGNQGATAWQLLEIETPAEAAPQ